LTRFDDEAFTMSLALDLHRGGTHDNGGDNRTLHARWRDYHRRCELWRSDDGWRDSKIRNSAHRIADLMSRTKWWNMYHAIGLGQSADMHFPAGERDAAPWQAWRRIEQATMSYGYGLSRR